MMLSKKTTAILLAVTMICSLCLTVSAYSASNIKYKKIIEALQSTEYIKEEIGLSNINFADFYVGDPIYAYDYIDNAFEESRYYYPLLVDGVLTAFAIEIGEGDELQYQISTNLIPEINYYTSGSGIPIALVFDSRAAYAFSMNGFDMLKEFGEIIETRGTISNKLDINNVSLHLQDWDDYYSLNYSIPAVPYAQVYFSCNVNNVVQIPYRNICWAACIATIVNYKNGRNYTASNIVVQTLGEFKDVTIEVERVPTILKYHHGLPYVLHYQSANGDTILRNIQNDNPIFAMMAAIETGSSTGHAIVVNAIHITNGYVYGKDPQNGTVTLSYSYENGYYYYVSPSSNIKYGWAYTVCVNW